METAQRKTIPLSTMLAPIYKEAHEAIKHNTHTHIWLKGGRGSMKSSFASIEIVIGIMKDKTSNGVVLRKVDNSLSASVVEQIKWAVNLLGVEYLWKFYTSPLKAIYLPTRQRIVFKGADEPRKIKSTKFSRGYCKFIWYEELDEFTPQDIRSINQTLLRGGDKFIVIYSYNPPSSVQSWVNIEALQHRDDRLVVHTTYLDVPKEWLGEQFHIEAEHLRNTKPTEYAHEYLGEVTGTGGEVFTNIQTETITNEQISRFSNIKRGLDFGYAIDPLHFVELEYDKTRKRIYIYKELHAIGMKNSLAVEKIKDILKPRLSAPICCDSAEPKTIAEFRELGLTGVRPAKKGADSVRHGIKFLQDLESIIIDPERCPNTFREFCSYELEKDKNGNFRADYPDKNNHALDSCRYALENDMLQSKMKFIR